MELQPQDTALLFKVTHSKPIEMKDFVATVNSLAYLFEGYAKENADSAEGRKAKLYVEKIEQGCIEVFLQEVITACALPYMENFNTIMGFAGYLGTLVTNAIHGRNETRLSIPELKALSDLFAINVKDPKGTTEFGAIARNAPNNLFENCTFNFYESNTAQNQIKQTVEQKEQEGPNEIVHKNQLMRIRQMRSDTGTNTGNRARVDALCKRDLPVFFDTPELKREILASAENPTLQAYIVDVVLQTIDEKPISYKVMALHDIIPLDD